MYSFDSYLSMSESRDSRENMLLALLRLLRRKPWCDITITDICLEGSVSRKTFYKYFSEKEAILNYLDEALTLAFSMRDDHTDLYYYFFFWYEMRDWVDVLVPNNLFYQLACVSNERESFLRPCVWSEGIAKDPTSRRIMLEFVSAGLIRMVEYWSKDGWDKTPQEMADIATYIVQGKFRRTPLK